MTMAEKFLIAAKPDLQAARESWLNMLAKERRLSALTVEAYERDTRQFLQFLTGHCGGAPGIADIADLRPADLRAFLAARRKDGAGPRTLGRGLAGLRSLLRFLERKGQVNAAGAGALRAPKQPKSLPKPLTAADARRVVSEDEQLTEEPWLAARDAARIAPFLRHPPARARRRPARHPGTARSRQPVDNADLYRRRHGAAPRNLRFRPSAGMTGAFRGHCGRRAAAAAAFQALANSLAVICR
jgi:hypothetical protein